MADPFKLFVVSYGEHCFHMLLVYPDGSEEESEDCFSSLEECEAAMEEDFQEVKLN